MIILIVGIPLRIANVLSVDSSSKTNTSRLEIPFWLNTLLMQSWAFFSSLRIGISTDTDSGILLNLFFTTLIVKLLSTTRSSEALDRKSMNLIKYLWEAQSVEQRYMAP